METSHYILETDDLNISKEGMRKRFSMLMTGYFISCFTATLKIQEGGKKKKNANLSQAASRNILFNVFFPLQMKFPNFHKKISSIWKFLKNNFRIKAKHVRHLLPPKLNNFFDRKLLHIYQTFSL